MAACLFKPIVLQLAPYNLNKVLLSALGREWPPPASAPSPNAAGGDGSGGDVVWTTVAAGLSNSKGGSGNGSGVAAPSGAADQEAGAGEDGFRRFEERAAANLAAEQHCAGGTVVSTGAAAGATATGADLQRSGVAASVGGSGNATPSLSGSASAATTAVKDAIGGGKASVQPSLLAAARQLMHSQTDPSLAASVRTGSPGATGIAGSGSSGGRSSDHNGRGSLPHFSSDRVDSSPAGAAGHRRQRSSPGAPPPAFAGAPAAGEPMEPGTPLRSEPSGSGDDLPELPGATGRAGRATKAEGGTGAGTAGAPAPAPAPGGARAASASPFIASASGGAAGVAGAAGPGPGSAAAARAAVPTAPPPPPQAAPAAARARLAAAPQPPQLQRGPEALPVASPAALALCLLEGLDPSELFSNANSNVGTSPNGAPAGVPARAVPPLPVLSAASQPAGPHQMGGFEGRPSAQVGFLICWGLACLLPLSVTCRHSLECVGSPAGSGMQHERLEFAMRGHQLT